MAAQLPTQLLPLQLLEPLNSTAREVAALYLLQQQQLWLQVLVKRQ